ncbi:Short-chain dehydrogenase/reductase family protein [Mycena kentingensis (nom. inval.)]|nr:Short-chain dehydrogenase/reductase family protein [Mycena kentingensis (nom. inval.)]
MDAPLHPPLRVTALENTHLSTKITQKRLEAFLLDFQERATAAQGGLPAVTVQVQKLAAALKEEREEMKGSDAVRREPAEEGARVVEDVHGADEPAAVPAREEVALLVAAMAMRRGLKPEGKAYVKDFLALSFDAKLGMLFIDNYATQESKRADARADSSFTPSKNLICLDIVYGRPDIDTMWTKERLKRA